MRAYLGLVQQTDQDAERLQVCVVLLLGVCVQELLVQDLCEALN